jgi:hypothetical protein
MPVNKRQTLHVIKNLLKGGTPKWYSHPEDYREMVNEWHKEAKENLLAECRAYKVDDQDMLADPSDRRVQMMTAGNFMGKLRREGGLTCFSHDSQLADGSASLFVLMPGRNGSEFRPICSIQVPLMYEWSLLRIDPRTGLATGFRDIGWRSAVKCLIIQGALKESHAHEIFGRPREARVSRIYRRELWEYRNSRSKNAA